MQTSAPSLRQWPAYAEKAVIYQLFLRSFTLEGTLKAAEKLLPHLAGLGIDIVYLCPPVVADDDMDKSHWSDRQNKSGFENPKNPYRLKDYYHVDPEYGTDQDLKDFVATAHRLGMKALLDLVYFHCGPKAVFLDEHPEYVQLNDDGSIKFGRWHFPMLNFDNPELREYLWQNMEYFIRDFDFDGFRCDVSGMVPLDFWVEGRRRIECLKPGGIFMLAETNGNREEQLEAFDLSYGFINGHKTVEVIEGKLSAKGLRDVMTEERKRLDGARIIRSFDNHDIASDHYELRAERIAPLAKTNAALAMDFALDGIPFLYNGQEIADGRRHSLWANREHGKNLVIEWENAVTERGKARMAYLKNLIALRRSLPILTRGSFEWIDNDRDEYVFSFLRKLDGKTMLCAFNFSGDPQTVRFTPPLPPAAEFRFNDGAERRGDALLLAPYGVAWMEY